MWAKIVNGTAVYPPHNDGNKINVHLDSEWLSANGYTDMTAEEIAPYIAASVPSQTEFTQRQIRIAMRELGVESILDSILTDPICYRDWIEAQGIDLNNSSVASAIAAAGITGEQIAAIKTKILEG